jgi:60 kDa SS-A/Ro ribonucleoprotein
MATNYAKHVSKKETAQTEAIPGKNQVQNDAGGFVWKVDKWTQLNRFLMMGSEGGTYYSSEKTLTIENAKSLSECIIEDPIKTVRQIVEISNSGRAFKNDPAIFALAVVLTEANVEGKREAEKAFTKVCRTGTHLFTFVSYIDHLRSWGRIIRRAVSSWYLSKDFETILRQVTKYAQRGGWSHKDVLRLAHTKSEGDQKLAIQLAVKGYNDEIKDKSRYLEALQLIKEDISKEKLVSLIVENKLPREVIPTEKLNNPAVWEALLNNMPITALLRTLNRLTVSGVLSEGSFSSINKVRDTITNLDVLKKGRVHPVSILIALRTYSQGRGEKGKLTWEPVQQIVDALNEAFYISFGAVESTGKNYFLALDVSGSMSSSTYGTPLSCCEITAAMSMVTARTEKNYIIRGFSSELKDLGISPTQRLDTVLKKVQLSNFGSTDCSLPMQQALKEKYDIDTFCVYTDNETYAGKIHPSQALAKYRSGMNKPNARLAVFGISANSFSIADPTDPGMMDFVGFDPNAPQALAEFSKGTL